MKQQHKQIHPKVWKQEQSAQIVAQENADKSGEPWAVVLNTGHVFVRPQRRALHIESARVVAVCVPQS